MTIIARELENCTSLYNLHHQEKREVSGLWNANDFIIQFESQFQRLFQDVPDKLELYLSCMNALLMDLIFSPFMNSRRRIRTPVKGRVCKHHQCFDYDSFMGINSRRPSWSCPHCNQSVCYPDIRIDRNMAKVLKEVSENVVEVTISTDGSWKAVLEGKDCTDQTYGGTRSCQQEVSEQCESGGFSSARVVDLTVGRDNNAGDLSIFGREEREPFLSNHQEFSITKDLVPPEVNNTITADQIASAQLEDNFWSRLLAITSTSFSSTASVNSDAHVDAEIFYTPPFSCTLSPVLTDAVSPALSRESAIIHGEARATISLPQNQLFDTHDLQLLHSGAETLIASNDFGRCRKVSCPPSETHAILAQAQGPSLCQQTRALNSLVPSIATSSTSQSTHAPNMDVFDAVNRGTESDQLFPRSHLNSFSVLNEASISTQHWSATQNWVDNDHPHVSTKSAQHVFGLPTQGPDSYGIPTARPPPSKIRNPNHSTSPVWRMAHGMAQSESMVHPSIHIHSVQTQQRGCGGQAMAAVSNKQPPLRSAAHPNAQVSRTPPSVPVQLRPCITVDMVAKRLRTAGEQRQNMGGITQPSSMGDDSAALASEQNWLPSGRMRGSITGNAYSAALSQSMILPTQPVQNSQSSSHNPTSTLNGALQMRGFVPNNNSAYSNSKAQIYPRSGDAANVSENSDSLPEQTPGKH